jgi:hypothetical protein
MICVLQRIVLFASIVLVSTAYAKSNPSNNKDLFFNEGLYYAYQEQYFDAISKIDAELGQYYGLDEPELNSLHLTLNYITVCTTGQDGQSNRC